MKPSTAPCGYFKIFSTAVLVSFDFQSQTSTLTKTALVVPDGNTVVLLKYAMAVLFIINKILKRIP